jgi:nucleoside phosphorylase
MELAPLKALNLPNVICLETGVGPRNAERAIRRTIHAARPAAVIHIGLAGALSESLALGDILVADHIDGLRQAGVDRRLLHATSTLKLNGVTIRTGTVFTYDRILATAKEKRALAADLDKGTVACVDMESAVVAGACGESAVPYLAIRCISDAFDEDLPVDLNHCRDRDGNVDTLRVLWAIARHPRSIAGLMELHRRARSCARTLARVVQAVVARVPRPTDLSERGA